MKVSCGIITITCDNNNCNNYTKKATWIEKSTGEFFNAGNCCLIDHYCEDDECEKCKD